MNAHSKGLKIALMSNVFLAVMEPVTWCMMLFSRSDVALSAIGLGSLKYFTVLSNLLLGLASLVYAICIIRFLRSGAGIPSWAHKLKYAATVAVTVTLMTVLLFLGPTLGYPLMFVGANLWFHLVLPVIALVEFIFFDTANSLSFKTTLIGVVPTLLYGLVYVANILMNGVGSGAATNDWYGFTMWGVELIPVVLLVMLIATWVFALVIYAANALVRRKSS